MAKYEMDFASGGAEPLTIEIFSDGHPNATHNGGFVVDTQKYSKVKLISKRGQTADVALSYSGNLHTFTNIGDEQQIPKDVGQVFILVSNTSSGYNTAYATVMLS